MGSITDTNSTLPVRAKDGVKFGKELREKEFLFEKGYLNLNHGMWSLLLLFSDATVPSWCIELYTFGDTYPRRNMHILEGFS
jgi:hypothetical protein